jgi:hypothetical protein
MLPFPDPGTTKQTWYVPIAQSNDAKALFAGMILFDVERKRHVELMLHDRDEDLSEAMRKGSADAFDAATRAAIADHKTVPVLRFEHATDLADQLSFFTSAMRKARGLGVHVEASGVAHPWQRWTELISKGDPHSLYQALMVHVAGESDLTSFGMRQVELPDASAPRTADQDAGWLLTAFNLYHWFEKPTFTSGQTFSVDEAAPRFRLHHGPDDRYEDGHPYLNPHGVWKLTPAA